MAKIKNFILHKLGSNFLLISETCKPNYIMDNFDYIYNTTYKLNDNLQSHINNLHITKTLSFEPINQSKIKNKNKTGIKSKIFQDFIFEIENFFINELNQSAKQIVSTSYHNIHQEDITILKNEYSNIRWALKFLEVGNLAYNGKIDHCFIELYHIKILVGIENLPPVIRQWTSFDKNKQNELKKILNNENEYKKLNKQTESRTIKQKKIL